MQHATFESTTWPQDVVQLLDEHHLVVLSDSAAARGRFGVTLEQFIRAMPETEVVIIDGGQAVDLPTFCRQLERHFPVPPLRHNRWWRDTQSVIETLRRAPAAPKRRFFLWREAHVMLESDVRLFSQLVNALFGVAAEREHVDPDLLVVQRVVFIGGEKLGAYAEDLNGQFCRWLEEEDGSPFWEVISAVDRPPVMCYRVDG